MSGSAKFRERMLREGVATDDESVAILGDILDACYTSHPCPKDHEHAVSCFPQNVARAAARAVVDGPEEVLDAFIDALTAGVPSTPSD